MNKWNTPLWITWIAAWILIGLAAFSLIHSYMWQSDNIQMLQRQVREQELRLQEVKDAQETYDKTLIKHSTRLSTMERIGVEIHVVNRDKWYVDAVALFEAEGEGETETGKE